MRDRTALGDAARDDDAGGLAWSLHGLAAQWAADDVTIARALRLTAGDYLALKHLLLTDRPLGPADLARLLGMTTGATNALVNRLAAAGRLARHPHPSDRRRLVLRITDHTRQEVLRLLEPRSTSIARITDELDARDRAVIHAFIDAIRDDAAPTGP